ncbi:unnamed protein product [Candidula unifasciata]|uniref:Fibrinogen C-terminal domain-containing protein n=1 Tax=Candidula unifasciata TaxID=100452 RepID=A0A8S3Z4G9_9EUPU|nr:unnamed protein product [Candidula unifasciata]
MLYFILYGLFVSCQGLQMYMERIPGHAVCGELRCWNDAQPDGNIFSTTSISLYDVTEPGSSIKVASISANAPGLYINQSKAQDLSGSGNISRYSADLSLSFRNNADCVSGSFLCELEFVNTDGAIDTISQKAASESNTAAQANSTISPASSTGATTSSACSCSALTSQISELSGRLDQVERDTAELRLNKSLLEAELASLRQQNTQIQSNFNHLSQQVSEIQGYLNASSVTTGAPSVATQATSVATQATSAVTSAPSTQKPVQTISACTKGVTHTSSREKFLLWNKVEALCDTDTDGGGWIVIQRRVHGDVNFYQDWDNYKNGFGSLDTDFWIGNEIIHNLTSQSYNELRVDMELNGVRYFAHYSIFNVDNEVLNYRMTVSSYSGNAGDSLAYHNEMMFSTLDRDNDKDSRSCATHHTSAWWYKSCYRSNLNGIWGKNAEGGVIWQGISTSHSLTFTEMKLRHV